MSSLRLACVRFVLFQLFIDTPKAAPVCVACIQADSVANQTVPELKSQSNFPKCNSDQLVAFCLPDMNNKLNMHRGKGGWEELYKHPARTEC